MKSTNGELNSFKFYLTSVIVIEISGAFSLDGTEKKLKVDLHEILHDKQTTNTWVVYNLVPRAFPLKVGGTFKGKALGTRLE